MFPVFSDGKENTYTLAMSWLFTSYIKSLSRDNAV